MVNNLAHGAWRRHSEVRSRGRDRIGVAIFAGATMLGIWFGFAGPSISPVSPPPAPSPGSAAIDASMVLVPSVSGFGPG